MSDLTTVIVAAWNAKAVLPASIASAAQQCGGNVEIVVVDDASQDDTAQMMSAYPSVKFRRLDQNRGPSAARNTALDLATGDWVAVLDADDTMTPDCLETLLTLAKRTGADVVLGNVQPVDKAGRALTAGPLCDPSTIDPDHALTLEEYVGRNLLGPEGGDLGYLKPLFRKAFLETHHIRYDETLRNSEDYHIILAALEAGARVVISPDPGYLYRVAEGSISHIVHPDLFRALRAADQQFEKRVRPTASRTLKRLIATRKRNLSSMIYSEQFMFALKSRRPGAALATLVRQPHAFSRIAAKLGEALSKRLGRA